MAGSKTDPPYGGCQWKWTLCGDPEEGMAGSKTDPPYGFLLLAKSVLDVVHGQVTSRDSVMSPRAVMTKH